MKPSNTTITALITAIAVAFNLCTAAQANPPGSISPVDMQGAEDPVVAEIADELVSPYYGFINSDELVVAEWRDYEKALLGQKTGADHTPLSAWLLANIKLAVFENEHDGIAAHEDIQLFEDACELSDWVLKDEPHSSWAWLLDAQLASYFEAIPIAAGSYEMAIYFHPDEEWLLPHYELARLYHGYGRDSLARHEFEYVLECAEEGDYFHQQASQYLIEMSSE